MASIVPHTVWLDDLSSCFPTHWQLAELNVFSTSTSIDRDPPIAIF